MRILIVDQCSNAKKGKQRHESLAQEIIDSESRQDLLQREGIPTYPASDLYEGRQQKRISEAVEILRNAGDEVDRVFISAGFGVVDADEELPLYDVTFADMTATEIDERARELGIHEELYDRIVDSNYDVVFFALGSDYYRSARLTELLPAISEDTHMVFFNREGFESEYENGLSIPARTEQAKKYGTIVVALKGEYLRNFAMHRQEGKKITDIDDIAEFCTEERSEQSGLDDY
jgi:hypothetical protein